MRHARARSHTLVAVLASLGSTLLSGCPDSTTPPPVPVLDSGPVEVDGGLYVDSDGDGLCDATERTRGIDPLDQDTDDDGFTDFVEVIFGYNPALPASPDRGIVFPIRESPESVVQVVTSLLVRGSGEDFTGAFEGLWARDTAGATASDFYDSSVALYANPEDNAAVIEADAERFRGVVGRTELGFEVRLGFGDNVERRCVRAYPFRYNVKRSDGRLVGFSRFLLLVLPVGDTLATGDWCAPAEPCM